ncbi:MAG: desulfoferrodoxin [Acidimicrobiia bacterium]
MANQMGKRYTCSVCEATVLVTKAADGELVCHDQPMELASAKPLPSSD